MYRRRTDLALEAHELLTRRGQSLPGVSKEARTVEGCTVTEVEIRGTEACRALEKPEGTYVTLELLPMQQREEGALERCAGAIGAELRRLMGEGVNSVLVAGLGNDAMTPDAIGPAALRHVLVTRHLSGEAGFSSLAAVSALSPGVLGRTGLEAAELLRGAVRAVRPDAVIAVDALASRSLSRLCSTVQLTDAGLVPGSGVGNRRSAIDRSSLGVPVIAVGVPTVVDAATMALDILEEAGLDAFDPSALRGRGTEVFVTPRDIDAQIRELSRMVGYGIDLALHPLDFATLSALLG